MDKITRLMELLGEDNNKKIKDKVAQFILTQQKMILVIMTERIIF